MNKNCGNCIHYIGLWCPMLQMPTTEEGLCTIWKGEDMNGAEAQFTRHMKGKGDLPKNKKEKVFCKHCKQEIKR